ncbi:MAG: CCA tRNA nucleotidyltransferase [Patescibacteria group bacterium]
MKEIEQKLINWQKTTLAKPEFGFVQKLMKKNTAAEIYLVGGAVRDILLGRETKDFDFVVRKVDAKELEKFLSKLGEVNLVGKSFGVFKFIPSSAVIPSEVATKSPRSVGIPWDCHGRSLRSLPRNDIEPIDIALPRTEHAGMSGGYKDFAVQSDKDLPIEEDLGRRDFTINALAWDLKNQKIIDEFGGIKDLENKIIRAIGQPEERFQEDFTRMLRAVRFACLLSAKGGPASGWEIEKKTQSIIEKKAKKILSLPKERIGDEFTKIIMSDQAEKGIRLMQKIGLIKIIIPELEEGFGVSQNKAHIYEVFEHNVRSLGVAAEKNFKLEVRLAALFHDIAKPHTKEFQKGDATFYNHDQVGGKMAKVVLRRLNFSNEVVKYVSHLVRYHMFYYALDTVTDAGVRRLLNRLGKENIDDFINLRICDRLGMGRPKAKPWKLIELERRFKEVQMDPITPKMLSINGTELMETLNIKPGPRVGLILNALLGEVLEDPKKNEKDCLKKKIVELNNLKDEELKKLNPDVKFYDEERKRLLHAE